MPKSGSRFLGIVLVLVGLLYLLDALEILNARWFTDNLFFIGLIIAGIWLVLKRSRKHQTDEKREFGEVSSVGNSVSGNMQDRLDLSEMFKSVREDVVSQDFAGGRCSIFFGVLSLDLRHIQLRPGEQSLKANCVFGRLRVILPKDLEYSLKANLVASGMNSRGERLGGILQNVAVRSGGVAIADRRLAITATCTFGEIEIV